VVGFTLARIICILEAQPVRLVGIEFEEVILKITKKILRKEITKTLKKNKIDGIRIPDKQVLCAKYLKASDTADNWIPLLKTPKKQKILHSVTFWASPVRIR
jgi:hypothetical protein